MFRPSTSDEPDDSEMQERDEILRKVRGLGTKSETDPVKSVGISLNGLRLEEKEKNGVEPLKSRSDMLKQLKRLEVGRAKASAQPDPKILKIKVDHKGEKRCFTMEKPVIFQRLEASIWKLYETKMNMYYSQGRGEVLISIRSQDDLNAAVEMIKRTNQSCLRLLLSKHEGGIAPPSWMSQPDSSGVFNTIREVPYSETCSSCGIGRRSIARSLAGMSTVSSGIIDDDSAYSSPARAPTNYRKGKKIGSGSFGSVYVANDVDTGRILALKIIPLIPNNREATDHARGLEDDVEALARLAHPRILQYLGVQNTPDSVLIFMEYMPGGSVKDLIKMEGRLSVQLSKRYAAQVLEGLAFLHQRQTVHRDIKPANILRDLEGNVKIADFGSGKTLQKVASQKGDFIGTVHYTAPEVLQGKSIYGRKADIWSLGITFIEMLTGTLPFYELEPMAAQLAIAYEEDLSVKYPPEIDPETLILSKSLLDRNPDTRPFASEALLRFFK